jgi:cytidine deaminase
MVEYMKKRSVSLKSNYKVGAVIRTNVNNTYGGFNIEFDKIEFTLHAEQTAYISFLMNKGTGEHPTHIDVSAAPCGHCRQFLWSLSDVDMDVSFDGNHVMLSQLLPHAFDGLDNLVSIDDFTVAKGEKDPLKYLDLLYEKSITRFTKHKSSCVIEAENGRLFGGFFIENDAFNPSINPIIMAVCNIHLSGGYDHYIDNIKKVYVKSDGFFDINSPLTLSIFEGIEVVDVLRPDNKSLKRYSKYLLDEYSKYMCGDGGRLRIVLEQFYNEGKIKDVLSKNTKLETKHGVLDIYRNNILNFVRGNGIKNVKLDTYRAYKMKMRRENNNSNNNGET